MIFYPPRTIQDFSLFSNSCSGDQVIFVHNRGTFFFFFFLGGGGGGGGGGEETRSGTPHFN